MTTTKRAILCTSVALATALVGPLLASRAQDKPKDERVPVSRDKAEKDKPKPGEAKKPQAKKPVEPEDKDLDSLLEKRGATKEAPKTTGAAKGDSMSDADKPKSDDPKQTSARKDPIDPKDKPVDEHLEELQGRIKKKKQQQGGEGQSGQSAAEDKDDSPLGQAVKKMREVEKRLSRTDTGEETRKKQSEIVKDLDQMIAQARRQAQMQGQRQGRPTRQQGQQKGQQQGQNQPGANPDGGGVGHLATKKPTSAKAAVGSKDAWGHLPPELREEMTNVFREEPLPGREKMIGRYYESVTKKSTGSRGE